MVRFRCRFGVRLPFFKNMGVVVFYLPAEIAGRVSEVITLIRANATGDVDRIVWEAEPAGR